MNTNMTKDALVRSIADLVAGTQKNLAGSTMMLGGQSYTATALVETIQNLADTLAKADTAKAAWQDAVQQAVQARSAVSPLLATYQDWLVATYGNAPATLAEFGLAPKKKRTPLSSQKNAAAVAKRAATRAARHTMGSRQKAGVKGDVTGVVVTPVVAPELPAPTLVPSVTSAAPPP